MTTRKEQEIVRIELTPDQKQIVRNTTAKNADAIELTVDELEQRIAPSHLK